MTDDHNLIPGGPRRTSAPTTISVARTVRGAATSDVPSGTSPKESNISGTTVAAINMITVPATTGVKIRLNQERRAASKNWNMDETMIRLAIVAGPAFTNAATQTAINAADVPMMSTYPDPTLPTRTTCKMVVKPLMTNAANTPHVT